jgi:hypothetical protein
MEMTCHCRATAQTLALPASRTQQTKHATSSFNSLALCHCSTCRHVTGQLCASYLPITKPSVSKTMAYATSATTTVYFCMTCGCHVFRSTTTPESDGDGGVWEVATGVLASGFDGKNSGEDENDDEEREEFKVDGHVNVEDTGDGGLSIYLQEIDGHPTKLHRRDHPAAAHSFSSLWTLDDRTLEPAASQTRDAPEVQASCHCGLVRFHITRPNQASLAPSSDFPDLMIPYISEDPRIKNPDGEKWWLRANETETKTRFLAGTCACRSCRLVSGFEIQAWTFVPRSNIFFHRGTDQVMPLDFEKVHEAGVIQGYESSEGVIREFCPACGATVFWHDKWRPELIDVSVGLLCAPEGARAERWLEWWTKRVSFSEDAALERQGGPARLAVSLISSLESGVTKR